MFKGAITALVTPMRGGEVDYDSMCELIEWQIEQGIQGLAILGTTGESVSLTDDERKRVVKLALQTVQKRVPVMVGTGTASTKKTIEWTQEAKVLGADAALVITPYYVKPQQAGIYEHYKLINDTISLPIYPYVNMARTSVDMGDDCLKKIVQLQNVRGIKVSSDTPVKLPIITEALEGQNKAFNLLCGDDINALSFAAHGAVGCISVASNLIPNVIVQMQQFLRENRFSEALKIYQTYFKLMNALFCETNPVPLKFALSLIGKCRDEVRLPLAPLQDCNKELVRERLGILASQSKKAC